MTDHPHINAPTSTSAHAWDAYVAAAVTISDATDRIDAAVAAGVEPAELLDAQAARFRDQLARQAEQRERVTEWARRALAPSCGYCGNELRHGHERDCPVPRWEAQADELLDQLAAIEREG